MACNHPFYIKIVDLLQNRNKSPQQTAYYWPKDDHQAQFNHFILHTLAKYTHAYDTLILLKQYLSSNSAHNSTNSNADLYSRLQAMGEQQLLKSIVERSNPSNNTMLEQIGKQLAVLKGNRIISNEASLEKKVKRLVSILNALQCYIVSTGSQQQGRSSQYQPKQFKKCEVDRMNYLSNLAVEMQRIEEYKREALTLRKVIKEYQFRQVGQQHQLQQGSKIDYCGVLEQIINESSQTKLSLDQVSKAVGQAQRISSNRIANISRSVQQLKPTTLKSILQDILRMAETYTSPTKHTQPYSTDKITESGKQKQQRGMIERLTAQIQSQQQQLMASNTEILLLRQQLKSPYGQYGLMKSKSNNMLSQHNKYK